MELRRNRAVALVLATAALALVATGCRSPRIEPATDLPIHGDEVLYVYESGRPNVERNLDAAEVEALRKWTESLRGLRFSSSIVSYTPSLLVRSRTWSVNFKPDFVVLNAPFGGAVSRQYEWDTRPEDEALLARLER